MAVVDRILTGGMRHFVEAYPADRLAPGDVLVTNDPWQTSGQLNDFTVASPVFRRDRLIGWFANTCHSADIGGHVLSGEATEVYEEGLRVPIMKLFVAGEANRELLDIVRVNVRAPDETVGDLYAQTACNEVGTQRLLEKERVVRLDRLGHRDRPIRLEDLGVRIHGDVHVLADGLAHRLDSRDRGAQGGVCR